METKIGVKGFISEINRVENLSDFEKLVRINQHDLQGFYINISKMSQQR